MNFENYVNSFTSLWVLIGSQNFGALLVPAYNSNIAEGSARTKKTFSHYLDIALGSSFELGTQLLIAHHKNYITQEKLTFKLS